MTSKKAVEKDVIADTKVIAKVEVLDAIMSSGKTTNVLKWIDSNPHEKYIYVTPLLDEAENRLTNPNFGCESTKFYSPERETYSYFDEDGNKRLASSKAVGFLRLLKEGKNISCTHALFMRCTQEILDKVKEQGYIIILDEELDVITPLGGYSKADIDYILTSGSVISAPDGKVSWVKEVKDGEFKYGVLKGLCDEGLLYSAPHCPQMLVVQLPIGLITAAKRFIILTYLFDGSILDCFLRLNEVVIEKFTDVVVDERGIKESLSHLIEIVGVNFTSRLRNESLSTTWYSVPNSNLKLIERAIRSVCVSSEVKAVDVMYTFPKVYAFPLRNNGRKISPNGYRPESILRGVKDDCGMSITNKCWVDAGCRATNTLSHKTLMIHAHNRYPHQTVKIYLDGRGYPINKDNFALAEMLQWLFRGCIRNKEPMKVCILSERMLKLFKDWMEK